MKILFTNHGLRNLGGSELFVLDVATELVRRGHQVAAFSTVTGEVAERLERRGIQVVTEPAHCPFAPDIIHGQHHLEAMTALAQWPGVPALYLVHGTGPKEELPPRHPRIVSYLGNAPLMDWWISQQTGVAEESIGSVVNFFDASRFRATRTPPEKPKRALVYHNGMDPKGDGYAEIAKACAAAGLTLEAIGTAGGNTVPDPENHLPEFDVVFAAGRSAIEAMASGCAVIPITAERMAPLVAVDSWQHFAALNFCPDDTRPPIDSTAIEAQLQRISAEETREISRRVRQQFTLDAAVDGLVGHYDEALASFKTSPPPSADNEIAATGHYLLTLARQVKENEQIRIDLADQARQSILHAQQSADQARQSILHAQQSARQAEENAAAAKRAQQRAERWKQRTAKWKDRAEERDRHLKWLHNALAAGPWWWRRLGRRLRRDWKARNR